MSDKNPIVFKSGTASAPSAARRPWRIDLNITVNLNDMQADAAARVCWAWTPRTRPGAGALNTLQTNLRLIGPPNDPHSVRHKGLGEQFQKALVAAGKERLNQELQKQLDKALGERS